MIWLRHDDLYGPNQFWNGSPRSTTSAKRVEVEGGRSGLDRRYGRCLEGISRRGPTARAGRPGACASRIIHHAVGRIRWLDQDQRLMLKEWATIERFEPGPGGDGVAMALSGIVIARIRRADGGRT